MRVTFFLFIFVSTLFSVGNNWTKVEKFSLKKDRIALWQVKDKELTFRWTLFHNEGLIYLAKFDKFPYQGILYRDYRLNGVKIKLGISKIGNIEDPYCMIVFNNYDKSIKTANFTIYLKDNKAITPLSRVR